MGSVTEKFGSRTISRCQRLRPNSEQHPARARACKGGADGNSCGAVEHLAISCLAQPQSCHHAANVSGSALEGCRNVYYRLPFGQPHTKVRDVGLRPARSRIGPRHLPRSIIRNW